MYILGGILYVRTCASSCANIVKRRMRFRISCHLYIYYTVFIQYKYTHFCTYISEQYPCIRVLLGGAGIVEEQGSMFVYILPK